MYISGLVTYTLYFLTKTKELIMNFRISRSRKWLTIAVFILATGFYAYYVVKNFSDIPTFQWNTTSIAISFFSIILAVFPILILGVIWSFLLRDHGFRLSWQQSQSIIVISQFGKYLFGAGQYLGRIHMAREIGIPISVTLSTMLYEILWGISIGVGLAFLSLVFFIDGHALGLRFGWAQFGLIILFLTFLSWFGMNFLNKFAPVLTKRLSAKYKIIAHPQTTSIAVMLLFFVSFLITGLILKLQALWFFNVATGSVFELTCLFSIVWIAGYLTLGSPAGLGVREVMMVLVFSPILGAGAAVGLSLTFRLTTTLADAVVFVIGILGRKYVT